MLPSSVVRRGFCFSHLCHRPVRIQDFACAPFASCQTKPRCCTARHFIVSSRLHKKGAKSKVISEPTSGASSKAQVKDDPYDFSSLEKGIEVAHERLKDELRKIRPGGKLNVETLENIKTRASKDSPDLVRLGDIAQFVARGRIINILVGEDMYKKAIISAIQSSNLNLQPQPDSLNPLQLNITVPGTTLESRKEAVASAVKVEQAAVKAIREARQSQHKKHNTMKSSKSALPDDLKRAGGKMEKVVEAGLADVKKIADAAKKALETS